MREGNQEPVRVAAPVWTGRADAGATEHGYVKLRFALGFFSQGSDLAEACRLLAARGLEPQAVESVAFENAAGTIQSLGRERVLTDGSLGGASLAADLRHWLKGRLAEQVQATLNSGGGVLLVQVRDDKEQRQVCSTLLRHAATGVQTHDIRRPGPARAGS